SSATLRNIGISQPIFSTILSSTSDGIGCAKLMHPALARCWHDASLEGGCRSGAYAWSINRVLSYH
ncbi:hypothetical protein, partial [Parapedobacter sp. ISTM3]|uniref:hypothetical protein n=1 Tax=Parapedobacter sp. ISTM3 TaxID=2800130 RepID=UPI001F3C21F4